MTFHAKLFPLKKNLGSILSIYTEVGWKRSIQSKWYVKPSWGQHFNLKEYSRGTFHHLELPFDVKKETVLLTLKYVMKFWNLYHAGCGNMPRETWDMSQCVGQIHAFLIAGQRKKYFLLSSPNKYNTRFCCFCVLFCY